MEPITIDDSWWQRKEASVPIRKIIIKKVTQSNFVFFQDHVNLFMSWLNVIIYIYHLMNLVAFQEYTWFKYYQYTMHSYFLIDFSFRLLCTKYPRMILSHFCSWIEIITIVPFFVVVISGNG